MFNGKYGKVLMGVMIVAIIGILVLLTFIGIDMYKKYFTQKEASEAIQQFDKNIQDNKQNQNNSNTVGVIPTVNETPDETTNSLKRVQFKGFNVIGKLEIPKIKLSYPILERATGEAIEYSVGFLTGAGLNKPGNSVIIGHNYRNGLFFSDLGKVELNDKVYITDESGQRVEYIIYNKYETTPEDVEYLIRQTNGKREVTLQTCSDDPSNRIIVWAREAE